jgi:hypothetical protein
MKCTSRRVGTKTTPKGLTEMSPHHHQRRLRKLDYGLEEHRIRIPENGHPRGSLARWFLLLLSPALLFLSGCSVYIAAHQPTKKDLTVLAQGTPRRLVISELGPPAVTEKDKRGNRIDFFQITQGYSKGSRVGRVIAHGAADLFTLGCWEIIGTPTELVFDGTQLRIQVTYSASDFVDVATVIGKDVSHTIANGARLDSKPSGVQHDPLQEMRADPGRGPRKTLPVIQAYRKPAQQTRGSPETAKGTFSSACNQVAARLLAGSKNALNPKADRPTRIAVYKFLPREEKSLKDGALGDRISSELERALVGQSGIQIVTRRNLSDIQLEQKLSEAAWNQTSRGQRQFGVANVDLILRGSYTLSKAGEKVRIECELVDPSSGVVVGSAQASIEIDPQE